MIRTTDQLIKRYASLAADAKSVCAAATVVGTPRMHVQPIILGISKERVP